MTTKILKTLEDFQALKKGDVLVCKFHRDTYKLAKRTRFASYEVQDNKLHQKEIILQKQNNVYFNYECFLMGGSNLISAMLGFKTLMQQGWLLLYYSNLVFYFKFASFQNNFFGIFN